MTNDHSHLNALEHRLHNESTRLAAATVQAERDLRTVWVAQVQREVADERARLGLAPFVDADLSDDELLAELAEPSRAEMNSRNAAARARVDANAPWRHP